jgi:ABC-type spermidine/putrescine transport system permease subunit I
MNSNKEKVLLATAAMVAIMALFPPFDMVLNSGMRLSQGYSWIFSDHSSLWSIDIAQLLTQIILVLSIGAALFLLFKNRDKL